MGDGTKNFGEGGTAGRHFRRERKSNLSSALSSSEERNGSLINIVKIARGLRITPVKLIESVR